LAWPEHASALAILAVSVTGGSTAASSLKHLLSLPQVHREIGRIAGNQFLKSMQEMLHSNIQEFITKNVRERLVRQKAYEDHQRIYECIRGRYTQAIASVMEAHIDTCLRHYEKQYGGGERGGINDRGEG